MKNIFCIILLISIFACQDDKKEVSYATHIISPEPIMVIKFSDFVKWEESLSNQSFLSKYKNNAIIKFWSLEEFHNVIEIPEETILSFSSLGNNKMIKTISFEHKNDIKFKIESKESYKYDDVAINTFEFKDQLIYYSNLDGKAVLCSSKIILENIIRNYQNGIQNPMVIQKLLDVLSDKSPSIVINNNLFPKTLLEFFDKNILKHQINLSDYSGFDLNVDADKILMSGIVFNPKTEDKLWAKFKSVNTVKSTSVEVIPSNFTSATSILFSDFENLFKASKSVDKNTQVDSLYINLREVTSMNLPNGKAMVLVSNTIDQSYSYLKKISKPIKTIGDNTIYKLNQSFTPGNQFNSILDIIKVDYFTVQMDHIILSNKIETIENLIIQINNNNVVSNQANYNNHLESLNDKCHIQWLTNLGNQDDFFEEHTRDAFKSDFKNLKWDNHELLMSQLIVENDFGYFNILMKKTIKNQRNTDIQQLIRLKSDNTIINKPAFFENWRTGQRDVIYQDEKNSLYLKDTKGNLIWTKQLEDPIIGEISSIDIYQNKRIQITFATKNKIHVIDKNGNDVEPFPLEFRDEITQGLSVFDYDKNGKYRFTAVFDEKSKMYDKNGKRVRGFKFKKTKSDIIFPLKHIRMGNKDYIIALEENGTLHILDRRGKTRIDLDSSLKFSDSEWFEHDNHFTSVNDKGDIIKIDQKGKLNQSKKEFINPKFSANKENLVILSENKIYFNANNAELPYGLYTNPIINKNYAGVADKQAQKVYLLNKKAEVVEGFPVYGEEIVDIYSNENEIVLLCNDGDKALIVYTAKFR